jgi:GTPase SAR1 family protein
VISSLERRLAEFVNREAETRRFREILDTAEKPIFVVWGDTGVGKSSLLARMLHECAQRRRRKAEVVWTDTRLHDYMAIMRKIRDDVGVSHFTAFTDLINFFTVPQYELRIHVEGAGAVQVAREASITNAHVGDIAGILVKDVMLNVPRADMAVPELERMARLTDRFIEDLRAAVREESLVVFLDAVEKMSPDTDRWVWGELLAAVCDGRLRNILFVLCGQKRPVLDREWQAFVEEAELRPLAHKHIVEYLAKRGVDEASRTAVADLLLVTTGGKIKDIATYVDALLQLQTRRARGDE